jgi:8-oxo-dGTP pyrophosphatase MutT (NUDIX family)
MKPFDYQAEAHLPRNPMNARAQAVLELAQYRSLFPAEADALTALEEQLVNDPGDVLSRKNMRGHITTSAFVLDESAMKVLLIHHRLYNRWLQPGGHYDDGELWASALREAVEETGIRHAQLHDWSRAHGCPVDIDTHRIAARAAKGEQAHVHHDFAYLLRAESQQPLVAQLEEVLDVRWVSLAVAVELGDSRLRRIIGKLTHLDIFRRHAGSLRRR